MAKFFKSVSGKIASTINHSTGEERIQEALRNGKIIYLSRVESPWMEKLKVLNITISFNGNGGSGRMEDKIVHIPSFKLPECEFTPPDKKAFLGWSYTPTGEIIDTKYITLTENITLYAQWTAAKVTVSFDPDGGVGLIGTGYMAPVKVDAGSDYVLPSCGFTPPTKAQFRGWTKHPSEAPVILSGPTTRINSDTTLYAVFEPVYEVTLNKNGSPDTRPDIVLLSPAQTLTLPPCDYEPPADRKFAYWSDEEGWGGGDIGNQLAVQHDTTVYAVFLPI